MIHSHHLGYEHLEQEDVDDIEAGSLLDTSQYNYAPHNGYLFPGSGLNYVIGIDGHKSLVSKTRLKRPATFLGTLFCPCFTAAEPLSEDSKSRFKNCLVSFTFLFSLAQFILLLFLVIHDGFADATENPSIGPSYSSLIYYGAKYVPKILDHNHVWRFFSSLFLYSGFLHLLCNFIVQFRLGMFLEREWGWAWYVTTYFVTGVGANLLSCILQRHDMGVGATGPIAGMVAAYGVQVALSYRIFDSFQRKLQAFQFMVFFILLMVIMLCPFVNWSNIVGGFIVGLHMGIIIWATEERHRIFVIPMLLLLGGLTSAFSYFYLVM